MGQSLEVGTRPCAQPITNRLSSDVVSAPSVWPSCSRWRARQTGTVLWHRHDLPALCWLGLRHGRCFGSSPTVLGSSADSWLQHESRLLGSAGRGCTSSNTSVPGTARRRLGAGRCPGGTILPTPSMANPGLVWLCHCCVFSVLLNPLFKTPRGELNG